MPIALIALKPFDHRGTHYRTGERFESEPVTAAILTRKRDARFATEADVPKPKRAYRRRDLVAESSESE